MTIYIIHVCNTYLYTSVMKLCFSGAGRKGDGERGRAEGAGSQGGMGYDAIQPKGFETILNHS